MGKDPSYSHEKISQSLCHRSYFNNLHITIQTDGLVTGTAGPNDPPRYPECAAHFTAAHFQTRVENTQSPRLLRRASFPGNCDTRRKEEDPVCQPISNNKRRLVVDPFSARSSTYLASLNIQSGCIPGLFLPCEQYISMVIFGLKYIGKLKPQAESEYVSLWLLEMLQEKWPEEVPATLLPLYLPCSPQGPAVVHLSKAADVCDTFVLGRSTYRRLQTMAMRAIDGELACAIQESLTSHPLDFLQRSLGLHKFRDVKTLAPQFLVTPGQRVCCRQDANELVAIARDSGIPNELVVIGVTFGHGSSEYAHLATIAFRESTAKPVSSNRCKVKVVVISRDYEAVIQEIYRQVPENLARRTVSVTGLDRRSGLDHNYKLVISLIAALEANPMKEYFSV